MALFHCSINIVSRGKGKSAVASAAYRSGEKITNEYDGETHDYTRKGGIAFTGILLPDHAPKEYKDRSTLWNAVERVERAKNAQLARDVEVAIPKEIPREQWQRLMIDYCKENFVSNGMIADYCIHNKDPNNPHCHILLTMRPIDEQGKWLAKSRKEYLLDDEGNRIKLPSGNWKSEKVDTTDWNSQDNAELWRENWSNHCNLYLEKLGQSERIDHRSYERQGIDKIPSIHLGVSASQMEQKGIATERGNLNRQIAEDNKNLKVTKARITRLMKWQRELKAQPLDLEKSEIKASVMNMLSANKTVITSRYVSEKQLKTRASVWNFFQKHHITNINEFTMKIADINNSFYELQREEKAIHKSINEIEKRLELWKEYQSLKPLLKKYKKLTDKEKVAFQIKYNTQLERYKILANQFQKWSTNGKIDVRAWEKELATLKTNLPLCAWKMKALKEEIGTAEKIQKILEQLSKETEIVPTNQAEKER